MRRIAAALALLALAGCGMIAPQPPPTIDDHAPYSIAQWNADQLAYETALAADNTVGATFYRDRMLWALIADVDESYYTYRNRFSGSIAIRHIAGDVAKLGMTAAATVLGGSAALSAATVALQGTELAIDQATLNAQTTQTIFLTNDALRTEQLTAIEAHLQSPPPYYGFEEAYRDALAFYAAGTLTSALERIQQDAAAAQRAAVAAQQAQRLMFLRQRAPATP